MALAAFGGVFCAEPILRVWANEAFPAMLRSTAQGLIFGFARILSALALAVTPALIATSAVGLFVGLALAAPWLWPWAGGSTAAAVPSTSSTTSRSSPPSRRCWHDRVAVRPRPSGHILT